MAGLAGYGGSVYYGAQTSTSFSNEAMTDAGDDTTFTITDATKSMWDDTAALTVEKDTAGNGVFVAQASTLYTVHWAIGRVVFLSAIGASDVVRVSGKYFTKTQVARAKEWSLDIERSVEEDTEFGSSWETSIAVQGKGSGTVKLNWASGWLAQLSSTTPRLVMSLRVDSTKRYEFVALLSKDGVSANVKGLVEEELGFMSADRVHYLAS